MTIQDFIEKCKSNEINPLELIVEYSNDQDAEISENGDVYVNGFWWDDQDVENFVNWIEEQ